MKIWIGELQEGNGKHGILNKQIKQYNNIHMDFILKLKHKIFKIKHQLK